MQQSRKWWMLGALAAITLGCATTSTATNQPPEQDTSPVAPDCDGTMTVRQLEECIHDCGRSQYDNPEETPYDCHLMCCKGEMG